MKNKIRNISLACALGLTISPFSQVGEVYASTNAENVSLYEANNLYFAAIVQDFQVIIDDKVVGEFYEGTKLLVQLKEDKQYYIQWNKHQVSIPEEVFEMEYETDNSEIVDYSQFEVEVLTLQDLVFYETEDLTHELGKIVEHDEFSVLESNETYLKVIVNNQEVYINSEDYFVRLQDENILDNENTTNEDTLNNGSQEISVGTENENIDENLIQDNNESGFADNAQQQSSEPTQSVTNESEETKKLEEVVESKLSTKSNTTFSANIEKEEMSVKSNTIREFTKDDKYFEVLQNTTIYKNNNGELIPVGTLTKGQQYYRLSDYGNWHRISFGGEDAFIYKSATHPIEKLSVNNINTQGFSNGQYFRAIKTAKVYDNSSGALVEFGQITSGQVYPILSDYGSWLRIDFLGRIGYVQKTVAYQLFQMSDNYFTVQENKLPVYKNIDGQLIEVGHLFPGQSYVRVREYGKWHEINYGNGVAYVWAELTTPTTSKEVSSLNKSYANGNHKFIVTKDTTIYDNTGGNLIPFGTLKKGEEYPIVSDYGNWYRVTFSGKVGYVIKADVKSQFISTDKYFKAIEENLAIYINKSGSLVKVGTLEKGQTYERKSDYGSWHKIKFNNTDGYVWKEGTEPSSKNSAGVLNNSGLKQDYFKTIAPVDVFDNSNGKLTPISTLQPGLIYYIVGDYGSWYKVDISGRLGYVFKDNIRIPFKKDDKYFKVLQSNTKINIKVGDSLIPVGTLNVNQVFPRISEYGNWHKVKYAGGEGYIWAEATNPVSNPEIRNLNKGENNSAQKFTTLGSTVVYDNTSGSLVPFAQLNANIQYPYIGSYGSNWIKVDVNGRIGYVYRDSVSVGFGIAAPSLKVYSTYDDLANYSRQQAIGNLNYGDRVTVLEERGYAARIKSNDGKITGWVHKAYLDENLSDDWWYIKEGRNIRSTPSATGNLVGYISGDTAVRVLDYVKVNNSSYTHWFKIQTPDNKIGWIWGDSANGFNIIKYEKASYNGRVNNISVFTPLNSTTNFTAAQIDGFIDYITNGNKDSYMYGMGAAYIQAQNTTGLNAIYLVAHSALETGYGTSSIVKTKYNYFGISAFDACPAECATTFDGKTNGIILGAQWIANNYVKRDAYKQFTLDNMRNNDQKHQYATDEAWHVKIADIAKRLSDYVNNIWK